MLHRRQGSRKAVLCSDERKVIRMEEKRKAYEPPTVKVYQFDDNDLILTTASGGPDYAANALNGYFNGVSTTIEIE